MRWVQFAFLREGASDEPIADHLQTLLVREGVDEAIAEVRNYGGTIEAKLAQLLAEQISFDVIFIHRDADAAGHEAREREIFDAARAIPGCPPVIPVVPIRMTESWLLGSELEIRTLAFNPRGSVDIGLPTAASIEQCADPKAMLKSALSEASGLSGDRLKKLNSRFDENRRLLLQRLDIDGPVSSLSSWVRLVEDIRSFVDWAPRTA